MKFFYKHTFFALVFLFLLSCSSDDDNTINIPLGDYENGILVLNQGSQDFGSVSFITNDYSAIQNDIYATVNQDDNIGKFAESMFFDTNNRAYIIANGSNLITVVDRYTFQKIGEITTGLDIPRYGLVFNGKAYVTNQASFDTSTDDFVAVIDLENLVVESSIPINNTVEYIITDGDKLFIQNAAFGFGSGITVLDPNTNALETINTGDQLQSIAIQDKTLYALHSTGIDVLLTDTQQTANTITLPTAISGARNLRIYNNQFFYTFNNIVYSSSLTAETLSETPIVTYQSNSQFGTMYAFEVHEERIFIGDAGDFTSNGTIEIYNLDGDLLLQQTVGVAPDEFYFN